MASGRQPRIDLNTAAEEELRTIEGFEEPRARALLEHRERNGPFRSWEEVETVLGIGETLLEKLKAVAVLGAADGGAARDGSARAGEGALEPAEAEDVDGAAEVELAPAEMLLALARLDAEAAAAYLAAADALEAEELAGPLREFAGDHQRHVAELAPLLEELGVEGPEASIREAPLLLPVLARMAGPLGAHAIVLALLNNEQLTNLSYEDALAYEWGDDDTEQLLERNRADEQRHFEWLAARHEESGRLDEDQPTSSA